MAEDQSNRSGRVQPKALRALRHRNFQLFFAGQLISLIGTWMQNVAQSWLVYRLTHSALLLGEVGFCGQIPVLILAPFGGVLADRMPRRTIVVATQTSAMILAFILAYLTLTRHIQIWEIFVLSTGMGIVSAFDIPARQSFIVEMVGKEDMANAIALNSSMFNGARIVGPAVAGVLVAAIGEGWCFLSNAVSYIAVIIGLLLMRVAPHERRVTTASAFGHIAEGFRYVASTGPIRSLLILIAVVAVIGTPYSVLMPIFADKILHGGASALGYLMGAAGCGALCGALLLATKHGLKGLGRWVAMASAGFGVSLILFAQSRNLLLSEALLVPVGFCMMIQMAAINTLVQSMVSDHLRGRVMSVYSMMVMGMAPFGALIAGWLSHRIGAPNAVAIGGAACIAAAAVFASQLPTFRESARELILTQDRLSTPAVAVVSEPDEVEPETVEPVTGEQDVVAVASKTSSKD